MNNKPAVVLTRSVDENQSLASVLAVHGIATIDAPMIEVVVSDDNKSALSHAMSRLDSFQWIVFTSANGVRSFDSVYTKMANTVSNHSDLAVAVVGPATNKVFLETALGQTLAVKHPQRVFMAPVATAADLVASFPSALPTPEKSDQPKALVVLGQLADSTTVDGLEAKGYETHRVNAYRNVQPETVVDVAAGSIVAFFSPSAADRFAERYGPTWSTVCIGPRTAERAESLGFEVLATAEPHTEAGVVAALQLLFGPRTSK